jgi:hypothetical protein
VAALKAKELAEALGTGPECLLPLHPVSHHLRLLGVVHRGEGAGWLVLVDYDDMGPLQIAAQPQPKLHRQERRVDRL